MKQNVTQGELYSGENSIVLSRLASSGMKVKCAYFDPPYNNKDGLRYYDDKQEDDIWLEEIAFRAEIVRDMLELDGSFWISIDDTMMHYLKVRLDRVFGRENFVSTIIWQHRTTRENRAVFSNCHEYILVYARNARAFKRSRRRLPYTSEWATRYKNPDSDPRGPWQSVSATAQAGHAISTQFYQLVAPNGTVHVPPKGRCWAIAEQKMQQMISDGRIWFGKYGKGVPRIKNYLSENAGGLVPDTLWLANVVGTTASAKKHMMSIVEAKEIFETPKPEELLKRILDIATNPGEVVLDAYLGSGTTAAVAHKMGRRYIGIEVGDQITSYCVERLRSVRDGEKGGISESVEWQGGGEFTLVA